VILVAHIPSSSQPSCAVKPHAYRAIIATSSGVGVRFQDWTGA
jgi:hypothetical protein